MKKYKIVVVFLFIILCGCQNNSNPNETQKQTTCLSTAQQITSETYENFLYEEQEKGIRIIQYDGNETLVKVPETIDGKNVTIIGKEAFYQQSNIETVILPQGLKVIEDSAFYRCYSLKNIAIPKQVKEIGDNPFYRCSALSFIQVDEENQWFSQVDGILFDKKQTRLYAYPEAKSSTEYIVPSSVKTIEDSAFGYHSNLKSITILSSVTQMPKGNIFAYPWEMTFVVEAGSVAEEYAKEYGLNYQLIKE